MSLKPLVELTKFEITQALLSLLEQVLLEHLGGNGQESVLQSQDRGAFCS